MNRFSSFVFTLFVVVWAAQPVMAQDQQQSENSLLPEIDPQDIEIRSQFKARFPGLHRQPILGFEPTPRVYQIDPNRMPFMETDEQVVANLPVSELSRPDPPPYTPPHYASDINAFGRLGFGSFVSPEAKFWGVSRLNSKSYIGGDFDFSSSDGHLDSQESSFRFFDANAEYATKLSSEARLDISGGFSSSFNNMFNLPSTTIPDGARKEYNGFNIGANFQQFQNSITGWKAQTNVSYYNARLKNAGMLSGTSEERIFNGSIAKRWAGSNVSETFTVKAGAKVGHYDNNTPFADDWVAAQGGVVYERLFNYTTKVSVDASVYYAMDEFTNRIYPAPSIIVKHPLLDILTLTVKGEAEPYVKTLEQMHTANRFLNVDNVLRHSYRIKGSVEANLEYADAGILNLGFQYANISEYPIFAREQNSAVGASRQLFYETIYADAYRVKAYASITHQIISDKFRVNARVYMQSPNIKNGGRIPFEEKIGINSGVTIRPFDKFTFEAWADYVGSRKTYRTNETLDGFLMLGGQADVQITERFGAYVKLVNVLNQDYQVWQGYTERPFQVYGGLTIKL